MPLPSAVLIGGGHAHVHVLEGFSQRASNCELTLIVDDPIAVYSGMVPGFIAGQYAAADLQIDVRPLARRAGANVLQSRVTRIDTQRRQVELADGSTVPYDVASVNIGSTVHGLDLPGVSEHAMPTRPIGRFVHDAEEWIHQFAKGAEPRVVIVGGGAGGVELAFTFEQRLRSMGATPHVTLLDRGDRVLGSYPAALARRIHKHARRRGLVIRNNVAVESVDADRTVHTGSGESVPCDLLLWVTGAVGHDLFRASGIAVDERGFAWTRSTLQLADHENIFAVGDCATLVGFPKTPKAGVYSVRQGPVVTRNLMATLEGTALEQYHPQGGFLTLLNLGNGTALGTKWGATFEGRWVMRLKDHIDRTFMRRFQVRQQPTDTTQGDATVAPILNQDRIEKIDAIYNRSHRSFPEVPDISAEDALPMIESGEFVLVDVRTPEEQAVSMIPGAVTVEQFEAASKEHAGRPVLVHCTVGHRSGLYAQQLMAGGWTVRNIRGAILAWTHIGGPLEVNGEPTTRVHVHGRKFDLVADGYESVW